MFELMLKLFIIMNPIGNVAPLASLLKNFPIERQRKILAREMLLALVVMFFFYIAGEYFFDLLKISKTSIQISGGVIIFLISLKMIFPAAASSGSNEVVKEPFLVPIATPLFAGPGLLSTIMLEANKEPSTFVMSICLLATWFVSSAIMMSAPTLNKMLGERGVIALERLMGLMLCMISCKMMLEGIKFFLKYGLV